jgi:hypothetical protein
MLRCRNYLGIDWVPSNVTIENNILNSNFPGVAQNVQGIGGYQTGTPLPLNYINNITIKYNTIEGKRRALGLYRFGSCSIYGNLIKTYEDIANDLVCEGIYCVDIDTGSVVNIYNNIIAQVTAKDSLPTVGGVVGISIESFGTYNIWNNFIYGLNLNLVSPNPTSYIYGIKVSSSVASTYINFNSIRLDSLNYTLGTGSLPYRGIYLSNGTNSVRNNIVYSATTNFASYCIFREGTAGTLSSNYNDFWAPGDSAHVGYWNTAVTPNLTDWKTASGLDTNSLSVNPGFVSATNLHLSSTSSPVVGKGQTVAGIMRDFDNEIRDTPPEIGADEWPGIVPVEFASFSASVTGNSVLLNWSTATETNNKGFEVQRKENNSWVVIGFVEGSGTTSETKTYSFTERNVAKGISFYRIRQVDFDGSFKYSNLVEVNVNVPTEFSLSQNYPNPFNPTTVIRYTIPTDGNVRLDIFNVNGELVKTLVNENKSVGEYQVSFNAAGLASGVYIYKLSSAGKVLINKMNFIK